MDVIGFTCVSLGSSTVQLHDILGSRRACACSEAGFSSQNGDRVWGVYYRRPAFCFVFFLWAKGLSAKDIHEEMVPVCGGSVCGIKQFTAGWQTFCWWRRGWNGGAEMAETTVSSDGGYVEKCAFSPRSNITFYVLIHLWPIHWLFSYVYTVCVYICLYFAPRQRLNRWADFTDIQYSRVHLS
jgi:hypothetical protein